VIVEMFRGKKNNIKEEKCYLCGTTEGHFIRLFYAWCCVGCFKEHILG